MGEWKAQISLRIRQDLRGEIEQVAAREKRKLGNVGEVLLEWGRQPHQPPQIPPRQTQAASVEAGGKCVF